MNLCVFSPVNCSDVFHLSALTHCAGPEPVYLYVSPIITIRASESSCAYNTFSINKLNYGLQSVILSLLALLKPGAQLLALEHPTVLNLGAAGDLRVLPEPLLTFTLPEHCSTIVDA